MSYSVKKLSDIDLRNIMYEKPKKVNTYYQSNINYQMNGRKKPFMIQTPYSINKTNFKEDKKHLTIEMEVPKEMYDFFINLDEHNAEKAFNSSKDWFNQEIPKDIIDDYYKSSIKPFKEGAPIKMKVKIPYYNGECQTKIYDNLRNTIDLSSIPQESNIILILHVNAIRFLKQNFYTDIYVTQIKVCYKKDDFTIPNICIVEDDQNDLNVDDLIDSENIPKPELENQESGPNLEIPKELHLEIPKELEQHLEIPKELEIKENLDLEIIQMEEVPSREQLRKEKIERKLLESRKEYQYACNIFKQAEELVQIKNNRIKELEEKFNKLN